MRRRYVKSRAINPVRISRIYTPANLNTGSDVCLDAKAYKHTKEVLRLKSGDQVVLFNGDGFDYLGVIEKLAKKQLHIVLNEKIQLDNESALFIHLLVPLSRSDKMDWCLQKATELGVAKITPVNTERVNFTIPADRIDKKMHHWQAVINSACEQSGRARIPVLSEPVSFTRALHNSSDNQLKLVASPGNDNSLTTLSEQKITNCACLIGPEGGFSTTELTQAAEAEFRVVSLGPRILRLETAVVTMSALLQSRWGDIG